jgi:hypothetical protein
MPQLGTTQIGEYQIGEGTPKSVSINTTTLFLSDTTPVIDTRYEIDASVTELTISDEDSTAEYIALGDIYEITGEWNTDYLLTGEW